MGPAAPAGRLVLVAAPPGTGKTTVLPHLVERCAGVVVADIDEILEDGALLGVRIAAPEAASAWPAYDRMWQRITGMVRRTGIDVILLVQVPHADSPPPGPGAVLLGWEVPDATRAARLRARGAADDLVRDSAADAAVLRRIVPGARIVSTGDESPERCAELILRVAREHLPRR